VEEETSNNMKKAKATSLEGMVALSTSFAEMQAGIDEASGCYAHSKTGRGNARYLKPMNPEHCAPPTLRQRPISPDAATTAGNARWYYT
jgi:hypothetical protein